MVGGIDSRTKTIRDRNKSSEKKKVLRRKKGPKVLLRQNGVGLKVVEKKKKKGQKNKPGSKKEKSQGEKDKKPFNGEF